MSTGQVHAQQHIFLSQQSTLLRQLTAPPRRHKEQQPLQSPAQLPVRQSRAAAGNHRLQRTSYVTAASNASPAGSVTRKADQEVSLEELLAVATKAAQAGAAVVNDALDKPKNISFKGLTDLVTDTDKASEAAILQVLTEDFPFHSFLGEEGGVSGNTASEFLWVVDPLDGTTNFSHAYPSFGVSVAVLSRGEPIAAVVIEFAGGPRAWVTRTFAAIRGEGATCNGEPLSVTGNEDVNRSLLVTGFGYEHDAAWEANLELFKHFTDVSQGVRRLGAAAVDMCHVALGVVDAFWEYRLKPWDVAAGVLIVQEAGGRVTTMDGEPFSVFSRSLLASNGAIHGAILEHTAPATEGLKKKGLDFSPWYVPSGYLTE